MTAYPNLGKRAAKRVAREQSERHFVEDLTNAKVGLLGSNYKSVGEKAEKMADTILISFRSTFGRFPTKDEWRAILVAAVGGEDRARDLVAKRVAELEQASEAGLQIAIQMHIAKVELERELGRKPSPDELADRVMRRA